MKRLQLLMFICFMLSLFSVTSQQLIETIGIKGKTHFTENNTVTFFKSIDEMYQISFLSYQHKQLSTTINLRLEDELTSEEIYSLLNDVIFFDAQLNYQLGSINLSLAIENLLSFNDTDFAIEPVLDETEGFIDNINFAHEADFLFSMGITYNF